MLEAGHNSSASLVTGERGATVIDVVALRRTPEMVLQDRHMLAFNILIVLVNSAHAEQSLSTRR